MTLCAHQVASRSLVELPRPQPERLSKDEERWTTRRMNVRGSDLVTECSNSNAGVESNSGGLIASHC
jgi:hypothetical protein